MGATLEHAPEPMTRFAQAVAMPVEQRELLSDDPGVGQLAAVVPRTSAFSGRVRCRSVSLLRPTAQQPASPVEGVVAVPAATERLLLPASWDVLDRGQCEPHDVEGVEHAHGVRQAHRQRGT